METISTKDINQKKQTKESLWVYTFMTTVQQDPAGNFDDVLRRHVPAQYLISIFASNV